MSHSFSVRQSLLLKLFKDNIFEGRNVYVLSFVFIGVIVHLLNIFGITFHEMWFPFWALWPPGSGFYYLMLLPPTGAGAEQLAGAWTHQSLTESLVFFFLHVQGLKMGRIQPISAQQAVFHFICALFVIVLLFPHPFKQKYPLLLLGHQDVVTARHVTSDHWRAWNLIKIPSAPLISSQRPFLRNWFWYLSNSEVSPALIVRHVWLCACGLLPFP